MSTAPPSVHSSRRLLKQDADALLAAIPAVVSIDRVHVILMLLRIAGVAAAADADGSLEEDRRPDLMQWEFHDLLFHGRSRSGRHSDPVGAQFRFRGKLKHEPTFKSVPWSGPPLPLPRPDLATEIGR
jgi:oxazoline/thiazoline dehydrogenase